MENDQTPEMTPPGVYIREELEKRGWTQADLAKILDRPLPTINEIIQGKKSIMPEMAVALGMAFGTEPEVWLQRDSEYQLSLIDDQDPDVQHRAKMYDFAPVKDMERRRWIKPTRTIKDLEKELCNFFNVTSLEEEPRLTTSARQTFKAADLTISQKAWCFRGARLAQTVHTKPFRQTNLNAGLEELRKLTDYQDKIRQIPAFMANLGIRLVVVEGLPRSRIDGAAFWLNDDVPVILLSLRYDRIDCFWHTLYHECSHILHRDAQSIDSDIVGETRAELTEEFEKRADKEAAAFLIDPQKLRSFVIRVKPFYSKVRIVQFAHRMQVHPGIVTGQLQHLKEIGWGANREMLVKIREAITKTALTDGWGRATPAI